MTIYGAASLSNALEQVEEAYESATPGVDLIIATDSSAALRTQIEQGAPADVFLSADTTNPQQLFDAGLTQGGITFFASNALVVIVPLDNPGAIATPADLARPGVTVVAAGDRVPITGYATQVVEALAHVPGYP
ncbi:MAG: molybdate ABC transporter substrate-binding protein, partial [Candidatus Limnocylindria bacterium]